MQVVGVGGVALGASICACVPEAALEPRRSGSSQQARGSSHAAPVVCLRWANRAGLLCGKSIQAVAVFRPRGGNRRNRIPCRLHCGLCRAKVSPPPPTFVFFSPPLFFPFPIFWPSTCRSHVIGGYSRVCVLTPLFFVCCYCAFASVSGHSCTPSPCRSWRRCPTL
jgi:hypothetical protein